MAKSCIYILLFIASSNIYASHRGHRDRTYIPPKNDATMSFRDDRCETRSIQSTSSPNPINEEEAIEILEDNGIENPKNTIQNMKNNGIVDMNQIVKIALKTESNRKTSDISDFPVKSDTQTIDLSDISTTSDTEECVAKSIKKATKYLNENH